MYICGSGNDQVAVVEWFNSWKMILDLFTFFFIGRNIVENLFAFVKKIEPVSCADDQIIAAVFLNG